MLESNVILINLLLVVAKLYYTKFEKSANKII
jgi:hypothetical protein